MEGGSKSHFCGALSMDLGDFELISCHCSRLPVHAKSVELEVFQVLLHRVAWLIDFGIA